MKGRIFRLFLPTLSLLLVGLLFNTKAFAVSAPNFNFPSCASLIGTPGDKAHYTTGLHQIVGGSLLEGSDDVYSLADGNFVQCFCPPDKTQGIQTNWLRSDAPIDGWFFLNGLQWNLGDFNYAAQNSSFPCTPSTGGGGNGSSTGGGSAPQCPPNTIKKIDQVWFSNVKQGEVTVHWANNGDASSFDISYGPAQNNLIWGVKVSDSKANSYILKNLPAGDIWVSVTANASDVCGGPVSDVRLVSQPQVLAATGVFDQSLGYIAGFGSVALGLFQAQKRFKTRIKKA